MDKKTPLGEHRRKTEELAEHLAKSSEWQFRKDLYHLAMIAADVEPSGARKARAFRILIRRFGIGGARAVLSYAAPVSAERWRILVRERKRSEVTAAREAKRRQRQRDFETEEIGDEILAMQDRSPDQTMHQIFEAVAKSHHLSPSTVADRWQEYRNLMKNRGYRGLPVPDLPPRGRPPKK